MGAAAKSASRVPVHVLTGFLGSGKTTWLNRALNAPGFNNTAVVVNEFGSISIDHLLVEASTETLIELPGGCVCCAVRGDLARTLADLMARRRDGQCSPFERVVIETTGLADPNPIVNLLGTDAMLVEQMVLASVTTVVDAIHGTDTVAQFPEAVRQVVLADRIVLSKLDLVSGVETRRLLAQLNPGAPVVPPDETPRFDDCGEVDSSQEALGFEASSHGHHHGIESFIVSRDVPFPGAVLPLLVEALAVHLGSKLLRLKGLADLVETPGRPVLLHGVQHVFSPLEWLDRWPSEPPKTQLVFIVEGGSCTREWVEALLDAIIWEVCETAEARRH